MSTACPTCLRLLLQQRIKFFHQASFVGMQPVQLHRVQSSEGPRASSWHLVWCSVFTILKFPLILSSNLCFVSDIWWDDSTCPWTEEKHIIYTSTSVLCCSTHFRGRSLRGCDHYLTPWVGSGQLEAPPHPLCLECVLCPVSTAGAIFKDSALRE